MLSSCKGLEPRSLRSSIVSSHSRTASYSLFSFHREPSWSSKHNNTTRFVGNVCRGFDIQDAAAQDLPRKQLYPSAFWGNHHLRRYLPRYLQFQESRFSSSWGRHSDSTSESRNKAEANQEEEDSHTRWEKRNLNRYEDFMKKIEHDPYTALFGKSSLKFWGKNIEPRAATNPPPGPLEENPVPKNNRPRENWASESKTSSKKISLNMDASERQSTSETMPIQKQDQEYVIDPITNRKAFKMSASPVSASGQDKSQIDDGESGFGPFLRNRKLVSPSPFDRRSIVVEHVQVSSSSDPPSKDTAPLKPHGSDGWLAQEGFGGSQKPKSDGQSVLQTHDARPDTTSRNIESALDRHLSRKSISEKRKSDLPQLQYKPEENKSEDVDLLRPSDVRASSGFRGHSPKESDVDKQVRRKRLEEKYERSSPDSPCPLAGEAVSNKFVQKREDRPVQKDTASELRFGSWVKETLLDANVKSIEASKGASAVQVNELSDVRGCDTFPVDQTSDSSPLSKKDCVSDKSSVEGTRVQGGIKDKAGMLKAQIVPFKARLDAMKADYDFLRLQWLQETRRLREKAAKKEKEMKAQRIAKMAKEIHEEEMKTQKVAMEAMEVRSSDRITNTGKVSLAKGIETNTVEKPAPRRLQSFIQGEGDMASNVHEFAGRDRWYKRKAPHAMDAKDAEMDAKLQKIATDRALISEIRDVYEGTYGTIDIRHRQATPPTGNPDSTSGRVTPHAQSAASVVDCSKGFDKSQTSEALATVQKLFRQLRDVQAIIQDYQSQTKQFLDPNVQDTNMSKMLRTSLRLASIRPGDMTEATAPPNSGKPSVNCPPSAVAPETTNLDFQKATKLNTYRILAYDSATESVKSVESTTLAPFSKEELLLPSDALTRLSNPGKFLPYVTSLVEKGYKPVSGTSNVLVFKIEIAPQELAGFKKTDAKKELDPIRNSFDHLPVVSDGSVAIQDAGRPPNPTTGEDIQGHHKAALQGIKMVQQKFKPAQKQIEENSEMEDQKEEKSRKTAMDGIKDEKRPLEEGQKQHFAPSPSPSHTSGDTVHRQERVFSGSRQGRWIDNNVKSKRSKRAPDRRRQTIKPMLLAGAFTAACCYCMGVASEMMHGW